MRQGGDPRLPLELALVKVTRPAADLSRESVAYRLERLEAGIPARPANDPPAATKSSGSEPATPPPPPAEPAAAVPVELGQVQEAWRRSILPAVEERSIPIGKTLAEAHPAGLAGDTLTVEFPRTAAFHLRLAEDPKNAAMLREALYEVTGRRLAVAFALGDREEDVAEDSPEAEEDILELMKSTFDARELEE
jgi:hypothetical protein